MPNALLNKLVRAYLRNVPITEGKKQLLRLTRAHILPQNPQATFITRHGFQMQANLNNPEHERYYFYGDHDERYEVNNLKRLIMAGDNCWDIGANIGFYTLLFTTLTGPKGQVIAFEPAQTTGEYLKKNIKLNQHTNVQVIEKGISDQAGTAQLFSSNTALAEGTASILKQTGEVSETIAIDTLDNLADTLPSPDFIKIDIEGLQNEALKGGMKILRQAKPMIMLEIDRDEPEKNVQLAHIIKELGYEVFGFNKRKLFAVNDITRLKGRNILLVHPQSPSWQRAQKQLA